MIFIMPVPITIASINAFKAENSTTTAAVPCVECCAETVSIINGNRAEGAVSGKIDAGEIIIGATIIGFFVDAITWLGDYRHIIAIADIIIRIVFWKMRAPDRSAVIKIHSKFFVIGI